MEITGFDISGPLLITPRVFPDTRGTFMESYKASVFNEAAGERVEFVQDNQSYSAKAGTVRGLHFQAPPHAQGKLVRCLSGRIMDVAVDVRSGSPTYGQHVRAELSPENAAQLWVPAGFLHGFVTLEPDTNVLYKVTDVYAKDCEGGVLWNDPDLGIDWGLGETAPVLSDKDETAPRFADFKTPF